MAHFITLEGGDGSGKSTLLELLRAHLEDAGQAVLVTREPGGTPVAEKIREVLLAPEPMAPMAELFLYEAARADHVERVIAPALKNGTHVLCDRFTHSTLAYQGHARGLGVDLAARLNDLATDGLRPDRVVWLDLPPAEARRRLKGRRFDRLEREALAFHEKVRQAFHQLAKAEKERFLVLDAMAAPREIFDQLLAHPLWKALWEPGRGRRS